MTEAPDLLPPHHRLVTAASQWREDYPAIPALRLYRNPSLKECHSSVFLSNPPQVHVSRFVANVLPMGEAKAVLGHELGHLFEVDGRAHPALLSLQAMRSTSALHRVEFACDYIGAVLAGKANMMALLRRIGKSINQYDYTPEHPTIALRLSVLNHTPIRPLDWDTLQR